MPNQLVRIWLGSVYRNLASDRRSGNNTIVITGSRSPNDDYTVHLDINCDTRTRGHTLVVRRCCYDVRISFCIWIINVWNSLPDEIISTPSVNTFNNRLDKFLAEQEVFLQL